MKDRPFFDAVDLGNGIIEQRMHEPNGKDADRLRLMGIGIAALLCGPVMMVAGLVQLSQ